MFAAAKGLLTSQAAKTYVNGLIERYGKLEEFRIDSRRSRIEMICTLNGETSAIGVTIEEYRVEVLGDKKYATVLASSATRPGLQAEMRDHLHGRKFEVPSWAVSVL